MSSNKWRDPEGDEIRKGVLESGMTRDEAMFYADILHIMGLKFPHWPPDQLVRALAVCAEAVRITFKEQQDG